MNRQDDRLKDIRIAAKRDNDAFVRWLKGNCKEAVSHTRAREITGKIRKPIAEIMNRRGKS